MGKRTSPPIWSKLWLGVLVIMALAAPAITARLPLVAMQGREIYFPSIFPNNPIQGKFSNDIDWKKSDWICVYPLYPHDPNVRSSGAKPYDAPSFHHPFGTDQSGRDVMARLVYGTRQTLLFSGTGVFIALWIGLILGAWAGSTPAGIRVKWTVIPGLLAGLLFALTLEDWASAYLSWGWPFLGYAIGQWIPGVKRIYTQPDHWLTPLAALLTAFPRLIFLLVFSTWFAPNIIILAGLIGGLSWAGTFRVVRSITQTWHGGTEKNTLDALGIPTLIQWKTHLWRHIWPILLPGVAASMGSFILLEATLSFLQIPLPDAHYGWGSLLTQAKRNPEAWWLFLFPSLFLTLTLWAMYRWKRHNW
jgi:ABC-type dipeptide/oligopeptide/nickel transport system permease subunit